METIWASGYYLNGKIFNPYDNVEKWDSNGGKKIVIVAPHPDDETIGAGGVAMLHSQKGDEVTVIAVTDGRGSEASGLKPDQMAKVRHAELNTAVKILGVNMVYLGLPEWNWNKGQAKELLAPLLMDAKIIYTPSCVDFHPEHIKVGEVVSQLVGSDQLIRIFELGVPLTPALINIVADVHAVFASKEQALKAYRSQIGALHPLERIDHYRSNLLNLKHTEVFWQMSGDSFFKIMEFGIYRWNGKSPFRGIRPRPFTDPLASMVGSRERKILKKLL